MAAWLLGLPNFGRKKAEEGGHMKHCNLNFGVGQRLL